MEVLIRLHLEDEANAVAGVNGDGHARSEQPRGRGRCGGELDAGGDEADIAAAPHGGGSGVPDQGPEMEVG